MAVLVACSAQSIKAYTVFFVNNTTTYTISVKFAGTTHTLKPNQISQNIETSQNRPFDITAKNTINGKTAVLKDSTSTAYKVYEINVSGALTAPTITVNKLTSMEAKRKGYEETQVGGTSAGSTSQGESRAAAEKLIASAEKELLKMYDAARAATFVYIENVSTKYNVMVKNAITTTTILPGHTKQIACIAGQQLTLTATDKAGVTISKNGKPLTQTLKRPENIVVYRVDVGYIHPGIGKLKTIAKCVSTSISFCIAPFTADDMNKKMQSKYQ